MLIRFIFALCVVTASVIPQLEINSTNKAFNLDDAAAFKGSAKAHQGIITHSRTKKIPHNYIVRFKNNVSSEDAQDHMKEVQESQKSSLSSGLEGSIDQNNTLNTCFGNISSYHKISDSLHLYIGCFTKDIVELLVRDKHVQYVEEYPFLIQGLLETSTDEQKVVEEKVEEAEEAKEEPLLYVQQRRQYKSMAQQPNAPWHLRRINHKTKKDFETTNSFYFNPAAGLGVDIYIMDTGVSSHEDLQNLAEIPDNDDVDGHGTCVASLAAGHVCGVAKNARIIPVRAYSLALFHSGQRLDIFMAIAREVLTEHKSRMKSGNFRGSVVNLSVSCEKSKTIDDTVKLLSYNGLHVVASAGNDHLDTCSVSPGGSEFATSVGALDASDKITSFSNFGNCVDIWAPGVDMLCADHTRNKGFRRETGTSMSTAIVSGIMASLISYEPSTQSQYRTQLLSNPAMMRKRLLQFSNLVAVKGHRVAYISPDISAYERFYTQNALSRYTLGLFG